MAGRVQDKVVPITGGARGQGRSHAVELAEDDLENPTKEDALLVFPAIYTMPIPYAEPGLRFKVDAGATLTF